jgi:hypothetical protein
MTRHWRKFAVRYKLFRHRQAHQLALQERTG